MLAAARMYIADIRNTVICRKGVLCAVEKVRRFHVDFRNRYLSYFRRLSHRSGFSMNWGTGGASDGVCRLSDMLHHAKHIRKILANMDVPWRHKSVMLVLMLYSDKQGRSAVSIKELAFMTGLSERYVSKCLAELRDQGYIGDGDASGRRKLLVDGDTGLRTGPTLQDAAALIVQENQTDIRETI